MSIPFAQIVSGTPTWVFVLLAFLTQRGVKRLRPGVTTLGKVWLMPGVFVTWGLIGLFGHDLAQAVPSWLAGAVVGLALGVAQGMQLEVDAERGLVRQAGSVMPLVRFLVIFGAHYVLNVAAVMHPAQREMYMGWDVVVSGASAGYFAGWALRFWQAYKAAPRVELGAQTA